MLISSTVALKVSPQGQSSVINSQSSVLRVQSQVSVLSPQGQVSGISLHSSVLRVESQVPVLTPQGQVSGIILQVYLQTSISCQFSVYIVALQ